MSWDQAHGIAMIAAKHAHEDLKVQRNRYVDVFSSSKDFGVEVLVRPTGPLLGLYVAADDGGPACMLNAGLDEVEARHTLAHELGHHVLGHGTTLDHEVPSPQAWGEGWPEHEKAAEVFASWFLMPLPAVRAALDLSGIRTPTAPEHAYRIARWLGTPYATTVRHLIRLKFITRKTAGQWLKTTPAAIKHHLSHGLPPGPGTHIHLLAPHAHQAHLHAAAGDMLLLGFPATWNRIPPGFTTEDPHNDAALPWEGGPLAGRALWLSPNLPPTTTLTATAHPTCEELSITVHPTPPRSGCDYYWDQG
ncbi:ImmA/IrrE family metallo-endopeptidase [Kitasatospora phosalacinea]|uniref:IrrE N-terminal-like domain-containing protein n=1 Tax=Kitasatospora phosalacinea TaxID=2065 RepID=A0A9W6PQ12_9ACTN|nr:ImmA/IrrE family metallo-endopeptidase [Kitasatospora phosalacinea]GLW58894.1 hypothetical protein Kpho01_69040 [Kitasatospora phosalacinea]